MSAFDDTVQELQQQLVNLQTTVTVLAAQHSSETAGLRAEIEQAKQDLAAAQADTAEAHALIDELHARIAELEALLPDPPKPLQFDVCIHTTFRDKVYRFDQQVFDAVMKLKASGVRDILSASSFWKPTAAEPVGQLQLLQKYSDAGLQINLTVGTYPTIGTYDWAKAQSRLFEARTFITHVAGVNEPDGDGRRIATYLQPAVAHQIKLWDTVRNSWELDQEMRVGSGALRNENDRLSTELPQYVAAMDRYCDWHNLHVYPGLPGKRPGMTVGEYVQQRVDWIRQETDKPIIITEMGGSTANMSEAEQVQINVELVEFVQQSPDVERGAIYELMDDAGTGVQDLFGVVRNNFSDKPAGVALRELVS